MSPLVLLLLGLICWMLSSVLLILIRVRRRQEGHGEAPRPPRHGSCSALPSHGGSGERGVSPFTRKIQDDGGGRRPVAREVRR